MRPGANGFSGSTASIVAAGGIGVVVIAEAIPARAARLLEDAADKGVWRQGIGLGNSRLGGTPVVTGSAP